MLSRHFKDANDWNLDAVHYRGESLMWQDVASNAIQGGSGSIAGASSVLQTGNGRPIAVPSMVRSKKLPDVPTFHEQGLTEQAFQVRGFICLVGPAGMPDGIVQRLSDMMVEGGSSERIQKILDTFGIDEGARDRVYFKEVLDKEGPIWIDLIKSLNIEPQ